MSAQIILLKGAENVGTPAPLRSPLPTQFRASLGGAVRLCWHRVRLSVEAFGWIVVAASSIAAIR